MTRDRMKEIGQFMSIGAIVTVLDYSLLNLGAVVLQLPLLLANSMSSPISSYVSYKLNKRVVFEDRMHGRRKTLVLYVAILAFGVLVLQNTALHFIHGVPSEATVQLLRPLLDMTPIGNLNDETLSINAAKALSSVFPGVWNYTMLRRYVFVTSEETQTEA